MTILQFAIQIKVNFQCKYSQSCTMNYTISFISWHYENWEELRTLWFPVFTIFQLNLKYVFRCIKTWIDNFIKWCIKRRRSHIFLGYFRKHIPSTFCSDWWTKFHSHKTYKTTVKRLSFANIIRLIKSHTERETYRVLVGKPEGKIPLEIPIRG
jgi:hypothetical protein